MVSLVTPQAGFQAAVLDQLRRSPPLDPSAQDALLQALSSAAEPAQADRFGEEEPLNEWLGGTPAQVCPTPPAPGQHHRLKAGTLLGILDQGKWCFPLWQFDAEGPNGVIISLAKARWLQKPHPVFGGSTPRTRPSPRF